MHRQVARALSPLLFLVSCHPASRQTLPTSDSAGADHPTVDAAARPDAAPNSPRARTTEVDVPVAHERYSWRFYLHTDCAADQSLDCRTTGDLALLQKGSGAEVQKLHFENVEPPLGDVINGPESLLEAGDFNFDGLDDVAVNTGHQGPYGGPTYDVFLWSSKDARLVRSEAMSRLTEETLGFFVVDAERKRLITTSKSGCCYHVTEELEVVNDQPAVVSRLTQDATSPDDFEVDTRERLVKGKWVRATRRLHITR
jgi:hypothetical protein